MVTSPPLPVCPVPDADPPVILTSPAPRAPPFTETLPPLIATLPQVPAEVDVDVPTEMVTFPHVPDPLLVPDAIDIAPELPLVDAPVEMLTSPEAPDPLVVPLFKIKPPVELVPDAMLPVNTVTCPVFDVTLSTDPNSAA